MGATSNYRRSLKSTNLKSTNLLPTAGLVLYLSPDSIVTRNGVFTGWRNQVDGTVLGITAGQPEYVAADADFNGLASVRSNSANTLQGCYIGGDGITVISVHKVAPAGGTYLWYMQADYGALAVGTYNTDNNLPYGALAINNYGGPEHAARFAVNHYETEIVTASVQNLRATGAEIYRNGIYQPSNSGTSFYSRGINGNIYPAGIYDATYNGKRSSFLVYNKQLSSIELVQAHRYLLDQYRLS